MSRFDWSSLQDARLRALWLEGRTALEIGERLGKSRDAILGRVKRLNLNRKASPLPSLTDASSRPAANR